MAINEDGPPIVTDPIVRNAIDRSGLFRDRERKRLDHESQEGSGLKGVTCCFMAPQRNSSVERSEDEILQIRKTIRVAELRVMI